MGRMGTSEVGGPPGHGPTSVYLVRSHHHTLSFPLHPRLLSLSPHLHVLEAVCSKYVF